MFQMSTVFKLHRLRKINWRRILLCIIFLTLLLYLSDQWNLPELRVKLQLDDSNKGCHPKCKIPGLESRDQFLKYFSKHGYMCTDLRVFGTGDGFKSVCLDPILSITPGNCIVLSFGINNEWSFDDEFDKYGCKVYSFDPTMGKEDHQRSPNIRFFNLGIGNIKGKRKVGMDEHFDYFEVDRYENILNKLGLINATIDYLKLDVELSELDFFQDVFRNTPHLLKNIKQIAVELHHGVIGEGLGNMTAGFSETSPTSTFTLFWQYIHELECAGFKLIKSRTIRWTEALWARIPTFPENASLENVLGT